MSPNGVRAVMPIQLILGVCPMSDPRSQVSERAVTATPPSYAKLNKRLFKTLLGLIALAFSILFLMILIKLPGSF